MKNSVRIHDSFRYSVGSSIGTLTRYWNAVLLCSTEQYVFECTVRYHYLLGAVGRELLSTPRPRYYCTTWRAQFCTLSVRTVVQVLSWVTQCIATKIGI